MPGGPPRRQRTSSTAGGAEDSSKVASSLVPITGPAPEASGWLRTVDNLRLSVDNPAYGGAVPAAACGQTSAAQLVDRSVSGRYGQQRHKLIGLGQGAVQPYQGRFVRLCLGCHHRA